MDYDALADLYEQQYRHYRDDLNFYARLAEDYGGPVLEVGAGSARVASALARRGHDVIALELSGRMIAYGQERLKAEGLCEKVRFHQADMRNFSLGRRFPLVIAPFNTLMHAYTLADQDATLACVREHLDAGGLFALDLYNPNFNELNVLRREAEWEGVGGNHAELFLYQRHDPDGQILETRYYLDRTGSDGLLRRRTAVLRQRYFTRFELERALKCAGFTSLRFYGDFDRSRYSVSARHLICLAGNE